MKKYILYVVLIISIFTILFTAIYVINEMLPNEVQASSSGGTASDVQLIARAINGEARGEPYEGQVAVRSCNLK